MNRKSYREFFLLAFLMSTFFNSYSQIRSHVLYKKDSNQINIDGVITNKEIENSKVFDINNETSPGYNIPSKYKTLGYMFYTNKFLYVGFSITHVNLPNSCEVHIIYAICLISSF